MITKKVYTETSNFFKYLICFLKEKSKMILQKVKINCYPHQCSPLLCKYAFLASSPPVEYKYS